MAATRITRRNPHTGRLERPWRNREGLFVLGDPDHGAQRHHDRFAVKVATLAEVADLVRRGYALRMTDGETPPALIASNALMLEEVDEDEGPALWAETLPKPPFGKEDMMAELRQVLLVQANQIAHAGSMEAAAAFAGFESEDASYPYCSDGPARLDLGRFRAASYMDRAYDYAYQVGRHWRFGDDTAQDVREFVMGANSRRSDGDASPLADPDGLCRRAADTAFARWKLGEGYDLTVRELALLGGMKETAVRNSLSKERIAIERGTIEGETARQWLKDRRDFVPTRTEQGNTERWAAHSRAVLDHRPFAEAFARILDGFDLGPGQLATRAEVADAFVTALLAGRPQPDVEALRRVADVLDLDAPHFVGAAVREALRAG